MAWVESHTVLNRHRKVKDLAFTLNIKPVYALGHLHALWHTALEQQEDGNLREWSDAFLADAADFEGDRAAFRKALEDIHWLDDGLIHDWLDYAGRWLISKYSTSNRSRLVSIWRLHGLRYGSRDNKSTYRRELKRTDSEQKANLPYLTLPNLPNHKKVAFSNPTPAEVTDYARSIGFKLDGEEFCAYYDARGWKYGPGRPMVAWKPAVVTWKKKASPHQMIALPKPKVLDPKPEDCVGAADVRKLMTSLKGKEVPK